MIQLKKTLVAGALLCLNINVLFAAGDDYVGTVKDVSGNPIALANVTLVNREDSSLIGGTVTDGNGSFSLSVEHPSRPAFMKVSAIGYEDFFVDNPSPSVGAIVLAGASYTLGEFVVKASRPIAKLSSDGVRVAIAGTYLANTGTAFDVLGKMPFVTKTGTELEVLGKGTPLVYINGRQVRDISELEQLASSQIKSVDVVTNPGARYASTVNAVIRIATKAPVGEGFSFNDRTTVGYKHYAYLFEQANFNYRKGGFDLFGTLNYENYRERPAFSNVITRYFQSGTVAQNSHGREFAKYPVYQGKIGMNYSVGSHYMGLFYDFSFRPSTSTAYSSTSRFVDDVFTETLDDDSHVDRYNRQHLLSAYYSGTMGKWQLSANVDGMWQTNDRHSDEADRSSVNPEREFATHNDVFNRLLAGNVMASLPVWKGKLGIGAEVSNIHRTDKYVGNADYITDDDIEIDETTSALFAEAEQSFGMVSASVGLRWEHTDSKYYQFGKLQDDESRAYHNLAPSVSLSFPVCNVKARVGYSRKTSRPAFEQLNSAKRYINRYMYESGNPNLKPIYRDYVSASASWKDVVLELEYVSTKNYFMWQTSLYPGSDDVTLLKMENMPRFSSYGAYLNYSPTFFGRWHLSLMAGVTAQDFTIAHHSEEMTLDKPMGIFRLNNAVRLVWDVWLNADFSAMTSGNGENLYVKSSWNCDLGLYKSFANDTWSVKLQLNDVFDTWRKEVVLYDALSSSSVNKILDTRDLSLTIRYNFNSARSRYKGSGAANAQKNRF